MAKTTGKDGKFIMRTEEDIRATFSAKFKGFEYVSGYVGIDDNFLVRCLTCGDVSERGAQMLRRDKTPICLCCRGLEREKREKARQHEKARIQQQRIAAKIAEEERRIEERKRECPECGTIFVRVGAMSFCGKKCMLRNNDRRKETRKRSRLYENGKVDHSITLKQLARRYKNKCALCGEKVDFSDCATTNGGTFIAGDRYPSIDHIVAVVNGGTHTWENVQLAHRVCNAAKSDSSVTEVEGGQLRLCI